MSLPQRKKSADEIAKLRESFGIPGDPAGNPAPAPAISGEPPPPAAQAIPHLEPELPPPTAPPAQAPRELKPVRSLRRSERIPVLPVGGHGETLTIEKTTLPPAIHLDAEPGPAPHQVRSLRKSEMEPLPAPHEAPADSKLPAHRHSGRELSDLRRRAALSHGPAAGPPRPLAAHPFLALPGYIFAIGGAVCFYFYDLPIAYTGACAAIALLFAVFLFVRRPLSRHHAAFISAMALFVIVFGALHYFPNLSHGT